MKTRIQMLVLSLIALVFILGIAPQTCKAGPITTAYAEQIDVFSLTITSAGFDANDTHIISLSGSQWLVNLTITEQAGGAADRLTITGTATHIVGPHGEGANAAGLSLMFPTVNAANFPLGANGLAVVVSVVNHGQHFDVFQAALTFTTALGAGTIDITNYRLTMSGLHTPEPATLILLGTGLAGVAAAARRRRRMKKSGDG